MNTAQTHKPTLTDTEWSALFAATRSQRATTWNTTPTGTLQAIRTQMIAVHGRNSNDPTVAGSFVALADILSRRNAL